MPLTIKIMIKNRYLVLVLLTVSAVGSSFVFAAGDTAVPSWIKAVAGYWGNDQITDEDFVNSLT